MEDFKTEWLTGFARVVIRHGMGIAWRWIWIESVNGSLFFLWRMRV